MRLAHVLEHTTGFDDLHFREYAKVDDPDMTLRQGLAFNPCSRECRWRPGTHMSYCNSGPSIAAYALEKVTGRVFEDFVQEHIFQVLGMESSSFHFPDAAGLLAKGYEADGVTEAGYDHIIVRPSGALNTSSREMARFIRMLINRGTLDGVQLLRPETVTRMETPQTTLAARAGHHFGYGLGNASSIVNGHLFHGHDGGITGFFSSYGYSSDLGLGYFVSINKPSGKLDDLVRLIVQHLTSGAAAPEGPRADLTGDELQEIVGFYQNLTPRMKLMQVLSRFLDIHRVTLEGDSNANDKERLFVKRLLGGEKKELIPVTATSFRFDDQPVATMFNVVDPEGDLIGQWGMGNYRRVSGFWIFFQLTAAILTLLVIGSAIVFALLWVPLKAFGKMKEVPWPTPLLPLLATLTLLSTIVVPIALSSNLIADLGSRSPVSMTIFLGSLVFAALTMLSLYTSARSFSVTMNRWMRLHAALVTVACTTALLYLWHCGLIGLRTWAY